MRLPSTFDAQSPDVSPVTPRDEALITFTRSVVCAARDRFGNRLIAEGPGDPRQLYTETHYALAAVLLDALDPARQSMLELAESRLRLWATGTYPLTFFNAMAICLASLVLDRSGAQHHGLRSILDDLLARTREHRHVAYPQWCGNNAYLQQVAVDTVLLPAARRQPVAGANLELLLGQFRSFRMKEGLFYDLPRSDNGQERLSPPTYILKILFLLGVCHAVHPSADIAALFDPGMKSLFPLLTREGQVSYFGRTDNSPFAAGLGIFNLRLAALRFPADCQSCNEAAVAAERFFLTFPRTDAGLLQCNRFADPASVRESLLSRDDYAYVAQYSLAACAYALLGCWWFPANGAGLESPAVAAESAGVSRDLGVIRLRARDSELFIRTRGEITSWDRRYLGPTILRFAAGDRLLVGAISRTVATDEKAQAVRPTNRLRRVASHFRHRFVNGAEQLDGTTVGFLPVLRHGTVDYLPYRPITVATTESTATTRHEMLRVHTRGMYPCMVDALETAHFILPGLKPRPYTPPRMRQAPAIHFVRHVMLDGCTCRVEDEIEGDLRGKVVLFSVRHLPDAAIRIDGLKYASSSIGWGSDGRQTLEVYSERLSSNRIRYCCEIAALLT